MFHSKIIRPAAVLLTAFLFFFSAQSVFAEGSVDLTENAGNRPYTEWWDSTVCPANCTGDVPRRTLLKVYVNVGEEINLGSSVYNSLGGGTQDIVFRSPNGTQNGTCDVVEGGFAHIDTRVKEEAGPAPLAGGYTPCTVTVGAGEAGVWEVEFHAPAASGNPPNGNILADADFPYNASVPGAPQDLNTNGSVAAWDITVRTTPGVAGTEVEGRVFTNALAINMGTNARALNSVVTILTNDGYQYTVNLNGIDPFGFIFFTNTTGIEDNAGNPLYKSVQLIGPNPGALPAGLSIRNPNGADAPATNKFTHKIFFNTPDPNLPLTAPSPSGNTWLLNPPQPPPIPTNYTFVGADGTPGQAGTNPLGGDFSFDAARAGSYQILIDINQDGTFGNGNDRILTGTAVVGNNVVSCDGLDQFGAPVPAAPIAYQTEVRLFAGEIHFPFLDPEQHPNGLIIQRVIDPNTTTNEPNPFTIYYNDRYNFTGTPLPAYDFSLCAATGDVPPGQPPLGGALPGVPPGCYGGGPNPRFAAVDGVLSNGGARGFTTNFGDRRVIETWAYYPSNPVTDASVLLAEADLALTKTDVNDPIPLGGSVTYNILVQNLGPSNANGAAVQDTFGAFLLNVTWSCASSAGATCTANGTGNINDTVNIPNGGSLTYTVNATAGPGAPNPFPNTATVVRPPDVNDPNPNNNDDDEDTSMLANPAQMAVTKDDGRTNVSANGENVTYTIAYNSLGPADAVNVVLTDNLPAGATFVGCTGGCVGAGPVTWNIGNLAAGTGGAVTLTVALPPAAPPAQHVNTVALTFTDAGNNGYAPVNATDIDVVGNAPPAPPAGGPVGAAVGPDLAIEKSRSGGVALGDDVRYALAVRNVGNAPTTGPITVTDTLPPGFTFVSASGTNWTCAGGPTITCTFNGGIAMPGAALPTISVVANISSAASSIQLINTARVSTPGDINPDNDTDTDAVEIAQLAAFNRQDEFIRKTVNNPFAVPGDEVVWTITISNPAAIPLTNIVVQDSLASALELLSATASAGTVTTSGQNITYTQASLAPGASATITIRARVRANAAVPFVITNAASMDFDGSPTLRVSSASIASVRSLPTTGETPWWRLPLLLLLAAGFGMAGTLGVGRARRR